MKYFSDVEKQNKELTEAREFLELSENIMLNDNEVIEEGFFGKLFGSMFKRGSEICSAISKGLEAEQGKRWKTFVDNFFNDNDGGKAIKSEKAADTIKRIEKTRSEMVKKEAMEEKESYGYAVNLAFAATSEHGDDDEYKEEITKKIAEWRKLGGKDADKIINAARKAANKNKDEDDEEATPPEEVNNDNKEVKNASSELKSDEKKVMTVKNAFFPESLESIISEASGKGPAKWVTAEFGDFRKKYFLLNNTKTKEANRKNRDAFIVFINAVSAFIENTDGPSDDEKWNFMSKLLSNNDFRQTLKK